jgi:hypothetical protein
MDSAAILRPKRVVQVFVFANQSMTLRAMAAAVLAFVVFAFPEANKGFCAPAQQLDSSLDFRQLLQKLTNLSPDPCSPPHGREEDWHSGDLESNIFRQAREKVTQQLNATPSSPGSAHDRAEQTLKKLEDDSAEVNAEWPEESRFHFQILDLDPILVVKMTIRMHGAFFAFGVPEEDSGKPNRLWHQVGWMDESDERDVPRTLLDLYPLHRGPSGKARFLAKFHLVGCAGSTGVVYDAREWNPQGTGDLEQIIKLTGSFGMDDKVPGFPEIGELRTERSLVTLPYCWFSRIDTWDNPSLCAVDTYDLSGDIMKFRSRAYNRPDLVPIAKSVEYAQQRDYHAVLAYCASSQVARRLVRDLPPYVFAEDIHVSRTGDGKERVKLAYGSFDVEKQADRWVVVAFNPE